MGKKKCLSHTGSKKKLTTLLVSLAALFICTISGTLAYLTSMTAEVKNVFNPATTSITVEEEIDESTGTKEWVSIKNMGDVNAYVRAKVIVSWVDEDGNICGSAVAPERDTHYSMTIPADSQWILGNDEFYYYKLVVPSGESTGNLLEDCIVVPEKIPVIMGSNPEQKYNLSVEILAQSIQADGTFVENGVTKHPVQDAWEAVEGVDTDGTLDVMPYQP